MASAPLDDEDPVVDDEPVESDFVEVRDEGVEPDEPVEVWVVD
ncbi:MAG: hypothetical protein ACTHK4_17995 [Mycobacteriales bacterium]